MPTNKNQTQNTDPTGFCESSTLISRARAALIAAEGGCGTVHPRGGLPERSVRGQLEQVVLLENWARAERAWLSGPEMRLWARSDAMGEHDFQERDGRFWKATKLGRFGLMGACDGRATGNFGDQLRLVAAGPLDYLTRIELINGWTKEIGVSSGNFTRLEGVARLDGNISIITSQDYYHHDQVAATEYDVGEWLTNLGFRTATQGIWYEPLQDLALFDVKPSNFVKNAGTLIPVDVIPMKPNPVMRYVLSKAIC
jgi:hypothetical protein